MSEVTDRPITIFIDQNGRKISKIIPAGTPLDSPSLLSMHQYFHTLSEADKDMLIGITEKSPKFDAIVTQTPFNKNAWKNRRPKSQ
jgi:hypothetical protein